MKKKEWNKFKAFTLGLVVSGSVLITIAYFMEGFKFISRLLLFKWHFFDFYSIYNLNLTFYLYFLPIPYINVLPYLAIFIIVTFYFLKVNDGINLDFFITPICILLILYPSINYHYLIWVIPFIALNYCNNVKRYRKAAFFVYLNVVLELALILRLLVLDRQDEIMFNELIKLPSTETLIIRFVTEIPLTIGLLYYISDKSFQNYFKKHRLKIFTLIFGKKDQDVAMPVTNRDEKPRKMKSRQVLDG
ncbi:MAG: hypothetical protein ACTSXP_11460, partial [Promethearchaeota archaeon]